MLREEWQVAICAHYNNFELHEHHSDPKVIAAQTCRRIHGDLAQKPDKPASEKNCTTLCCQRQLLSSQLCRSDLLQMLLEKWQVAIRDHFALHNQHSDSKEISDQTRRPLHADLAQKLDKPAPDQHRMCCQRRLTLSQLCSSGLLRMLQECQVAIRDHFAHLKVMSAQTC
jgi:hypothetical protein